MKRSQLFVALLLSLLVVVSCSKDDSKVADGKLEMKNDDQRVLYSIGVMLGSRLRELRLNEEETNFVLHGIRDQALRKKDQIDIQQYQTQVGTFFNKRLKEMSDLNKKEGDGMMAKFLAEGGKKLESGLAYKILKEGTGRNPKATDMVEVHYRGTLVDGTEFDSSYTRGQTAKFPLDRVIRGWTEGVPLVKEGGKIQLVVPADLAYGDRGAPPKITGGATLNFEIELIKIVDQKGSSAAVAAEPASEAAATAATTEEPKKEKKKKRSSN